MAKILIVDDEHELEPALRHALKPFNKEVLWATSAEEAQDILFLAQDIELIISDHHLGGDRTGLDLWKSLKQEGSTLPFLLISGVPDYVFQDMIRAGSECPPFLLKPFSIKDCRATVDALLKGLALPVIAA